MRKGDEGVAGAPPVGTGVSVTAAAVVRWFVDAGFDPPPTEVMLDAFVQYVGLVATFVPPPGVQRKRNPEDVEISRALTALRRILPEAVKRANSTEAAARSEFGKRSGALWLDACERRARHLRALQMAVKAASESFPPGPGKKVADWHRDAESVAGHIRAVLRQAGHKEPKFTSHKGPATKVLQRALAAIEGFERPPTQIVEAFRPGR